MKTNEELLTERTMLLELLYLIVKTSGKENILPIVGARNVEVKTLNEFSWEVVGDDLILKLEELDDNRDEQRPEPN